MLALVLAREGARTRTLIGVATLAAIALYLVSADHGLAASLLQGKLAINPMLIHEMLHDGRHVLGAPCH